ncbi:MAG: hypothetical protein IT457_12335 [Planctomycetes bacterium]|nr:hypothetical protein [Planctomycetota bacterium]
MPSSLPLVALLLAVLAASSRAQQTWIVDAAGGGNFTDLPPAVDAASPGDTIEVRAGDYSAPVIRRALIVRGANGARVTRGRFAIRDLPAGELCSIASLTMTVGLDLEACAGAVTLSRCTIRGPHRMHSSNWMFGTVLIHSCRRVDLFECSVSSEGAFFVAALDVFSSNVAFARGSLVGIRPGNISNCGLYWTGVAPGGPAMSVRDSLISLDGVSLAGGGDGCYFAGGWGNTTWPGPSVLGASNSELRVVGISSTVVSFLGGTLSPKVNTINGRLLYDPRTGFGAYCGATTANCSPATLDVMRISQTLNSLDFSVHADPGVLSQILVSRPGIPADLNGLGLSWLDPATVVPLASGVHTAAVWSYSLPLVSPTASGVAITAQAAVLRAGTVNFSEAATLVLR